MSSKVSGTGKRFNQGKLRLDLVPNSINYAMAMVFEEGAKKYDTHNWRNGMDWSKPYQSLQRHLTSFWDGEELDQETGLPHLYHAACNVAMLIEYMHTCPELDDRYKNAVLKKENLPGKNKESKVIFEINEEDLDCMAKEMQDSNFRL